METFQELPILCFESPEAWHAWLEDNHGSAGGVWLKFAKKSSGKVTVSYSEALDEALCYGWIDSLIQRYDKDYYLQKFSPRKPKSVWSKRNVEKIKKLMGENRLQPSGLAVIEEAKKRRLVECGV